MVETPAPAHQEPEPPAIVSASATPIQTARYRFLAPFSSRKRNSFEENLRKRFTGSDVISEGVVEYADRVLDRQINKANGLLAFDGLMFTALSVVNPGTGTIPLSIRIGSILALLAALPLILLLVVSFGKIDDYVSPATDFAGKCRSIYWRTYVICLSAVLSVLAAGASMWRLRWFWL